MVLFVSSPSDPVKSACLSAASAPGIPVKRHRNAKPSALGDVPLEQRQMRLATVETGPKKRP